MRRGKNKNGDDFRSLMRAGVLLGCALLFSGVFTVEVRADEITYKPVNPSFGGNPFNGPYLLNNASAQRQFAAPERKKPSAAEQFASSVERALINRVGREIADSILGEDAKESGSFTVGETTVDFQRTGGQIEIQIKEPGVEGSTTITVPVTQY